MRASRFLDSQPRWAAAHPFPVGLRLLLLSTRRLNGHQRRPPIGHLTGKWLTEAGDTVAALCPRARTNVTPERANTPLTTARTEDISPARSRQCPGQAAVADTRSWRIWRLGSEPERTVPAMFSTYEWVARCDFGVNRTVSGSLRSSVSDEAAATLATAAAVRKAAIGERLRS